MNGDPQIPIGLQVLFIDAQLLDSNQFIQVLQLQQNTLKRVEVETNILHFLTLAVGLDMELSDACRNMNSGFSIEAKINNMPGTVATMHPTRIAASRTIPMVTVEVNV